MQWQAYSYQGVVVFLHLLHVSIIQRFNINWRIIALDNLNIAVKERSISILNHNIPKLIIWLIMITTVLF